MGVPDAAFAAVAYTSAPFTPPLTSTFPPDAGTFGAHPNFGVRR